MKILVIGAGNFVEKNTTIDKSLHDLLKESGGNSGNYMIGHGSQFHIKKYLEQAGEGSFKYVNWTAFKALTPQYIESNFDRIILCGANMINTKADFGFVYNKLSQTSLPIFAMGVGAQSEFESDLVKPPTGTIKLFELISERSDSIGVRGQYTQNVFNSLGVSNTTVNGCPSYYINKDNDSFHVDIDKSLDKASFQAVVTMKRDRNKYASDKILAKVQRQWLLEMIEEDYKLLVQTDFAEAYMSHYKDFKDDISFRYKKYFNLNDEEFKSVKKFMIENTGIFFDYGSWHQFIENTDFAFGARFHGNMSALMLGKPTLTVTHDTRTKEFCNLLNLPSIDVKALEGDKRTIFEMYQELDFSKFNKEYKPKCNEFDSFFNSNINYS